MSLLDKLGLGARRRLAKIAGRSALGADELASLSDSELEEELLRRRRLRARGHADADAAGLGRRSEPSPRHKQLRSYYANLELSPGASAEDVKRAYRSLMRRYHPDKHADDPEKYRAATELARSLTEAYQALLTHLEQR
ncbi:MAG: DnaJ domain-containing protein [Deltaproteobacteria bacterium]|nr:DnaJ domain-containing protein [Deltaproteobacteria bacterium]